MAHARTGRGAFFERPQSGQGRVAVERRRSQSYSRDTLQDQLDDAISMNTSLSIQNSTLSNHNGHLQSENHGLRNELHASRHVADQLDAAQRSIRRLERAAAAAAAVAAAERERERAARDERSSRGRDRDRDRATADQVRRWRDACARQEAEIGDLNREMQEAFERLRLKDMLIETKNERIAELVRQIRNIRMGLR